MMWAMMICCLAPILFILVFGAGAKALGAPAWIVIGGVVVFAIAHFLGMKKSHHENVNGEPSVVHKDPVCGMKVKNQLISAEYQGKIYYFCSDHCKRQFVENPEDYVN